MNKNFIIFQLIAVFIFVPFVSAQEEPGADVIQEEAESESTYDKNLERWQSLSEEQRQAIREKVETLTPEQKNRLKERSSKLRSLPKDQQDKIRNNYQRFKNLSPEKRNGLRERARRFRELPSERKEELRRKFKERRGLRQGDGSFRKGARERWRDRIKNRSK